MKKGDSYFMAGNTREGCGHTHRTARAAQPCARRLQRAATWTGRRASSYRVHRVQFAVRSHDCKKMGCPS